MTMQTTNMRIVCIFLSLSIIVQQSSTAEIKVHHLKTHCFERGLYDQGSEYHNLLQLVLSNLTSKAKTHKFYNHSIELPIDPKSTRTNVYGLFLCNSLLSNEACERCVAIAAGQIQATCPSNEQAIVWYEECMLWYSNNNIFSRNVINPHYHYRWNSDAGNYISKFKDRLIETFVRLFIEASSGNSSVLMSAFKNVSLTRDVSMSCYVECIPDLSPPDCRKCLQRALNRMPKDGFQKRVFLQPSCRLRYTFNNSKNSKSSPTVSAVASSSKGLYVGLGLISAVAVAAVLLNVFLCFKVRVKPTTKPTGLYDSESMENLQFEFKAVKKATDNFAAQNKLGQGGFGDVYKGKLANGQEVAVKRLSNTSGQGIREFRTEACLAAKLRHKNLVKLFGFCLEGNEMLLVYEFVVNKSLDRYLYDESRAAYLTWETRFKIIVGIAQGLLYLHEHSSPKIIHRDLKPSNILLDGEMNSKIADFGLAKLFGGGQTQGNTSRIAGTFGYIAPEYALAGHISDKSDIFSYGVILLEIISGKKNSLSTKYGKNAENLVIYAWRLWNEGEHMKLLDSTLDIEFSEAEVERCIHVGLLCIQEDLEKRPNMRSVLLLLSTLQPINLPSPETPPAFPPLRENPSSSTESGGIWSETMITDMSPR